MTELTLTLIRGIPGSGKSTLAKQIVAENSQPIVHLEADMYFINEAGNYEFDMGKIMEAHQWCQQRCDTSLQQGESVIVANTFVRHWEMTPYRQLAKRYQAKLVVKVCKGNYQNIHNVPAATLKRMRRDWQD